MDGKYKHWDNMKMSDLISSHLVFHTKYTNVDCLHIRRFCVLLFINQTNQVNFLFPNF